MKTADLHIKHLNKQIPKLIKDKYDIHKKNVIFRSDSKGRCLLPYFTNTNKFSLIYRSGGIIKDTFMQEYTISKIERTKEPLVILFFGTCELTNKNGKYIYLPRDINARVEQIIEQYSTYKRRVLECNPQATVLFLECPYFSIIIWNFLKGHPHPGIFNNDQKKLEEAIVLFNLKLKELNGNRVVPRLSVDFMYSTKKKNKQSTKFRNYGLLKDGVHANNFLAKLWSLRISRMIALN